MSVLRDRFLRRTVLIVDRQKPHYYREGGAWWVMAPMPRGYGVLRSRRCLGPTLRSVQREYRGGR